MITATHHDFASKAAAKREIQAAIDRSDRAVCKALLLIYSRQTETEKALETTTDANGVGFGAFDAEILTDMAVKLQRYGKLSEKQIALVRKKIRRYWKQLMVLAQAAPAVAA